MKYTCWGAARQVTGSMHLLELESGYRILIDCGLDYEDRTNAEVNQHFPFEVSSINALILTHAHIDHSGNIPNLVKQGYRGEIICTEPTAYLLDKLWQDSVNIQNLDRKRRKSRVKLYGFKEIKDASSQLLTLDFKKPFQLNEEVSIELFEAGHILGAASVKITVSEGNSTKTIGFTGDLGNPGSKLVVDPSPMPDLNYLVSETTYGNRLHREKRSPEEVLKAYVNEVCVEKNGKLIIPAFSVGRTQAILFTLKKLFDKGDLPPIRVFADSPLALASTNIHNRFTDFLNNEARSYAQDGGNIFNFKSLSLVEDAEDLEEMDLYRDANIVVSSAGMLEGGRIQQHLADHIQNPLCTVLIAGFCSPGTVGARLLSGETQIKLKGKYKYVYATVAQTDVFSAHPDADGLKNYFKASNGEHFEKLFFVHGEEQSMLDLEEELKQEYSIKIPVKGEELTL
jgi:metallo-beta-lactamase family protein